MEKVQSGTRNKVFTDILGRKIVQTIIRSSRPRELKHERISKIIPKEKCFFCPGNENLTPPELDRIEINGEWEVRVFPNKFPAFSSDSKRAYGIHEVIVETPDHMKTLSDLSVQNLTDYIKILKRRMENAKKDEKIKYISIFKNEGKEAGASIEHTHSQLVGMEFVPNLVKKIAKKTEKFFLLAQKNIFYSNDYFSAICPPKSRFQHEIWILPKFELTSLLYLQKEKELAEVLKAALFCLDNALGYPPYNIVFHSAPFEFEKFPFHIQILPRLSTWAGFEFATDIVMTSAEPKESLRLFKEKIEEFQKQRN